MCRRLLAASMLSIVTACGSLMPQPQAECPRVETPPPRLMAPAPPLELLPDRDVTGAEIVSSVTRNYSQCRRTALTLQELQEWISAAQSDPAANGSQ